MIKQLLQLAPVLGLLMFGPCAGGCAQHIKDKGSWSVMFQQGVKFENDASKTEATNVFAWEFPSVEELLMKASRADPVPPAPETPPGG